jgi:hypothetical protein
LPDLVNPAIISVNLDSVIVELLKVLMHLIFGSGGEENVRKGSFWDEKELNLTF